jgi:hypothetical protein
MIKMNKLIKVVRTDSFVRFIHEVKTQTGVETHNIVAHEAPLKTFDKALQALAAVAVKQLELPADYTKGIVVKSMSLSYTKHGTRSASIEFIKDLDATDGSHIITTPVFQFDDAKGEGEHRRQCAPKHAALIEDMVDETIKYAKGKRQQMQLPLESDQEKSDRESGEKPGADLPGIETEKKSLGGAEAGKVSDPGGSRRFGIPLFRLEPDPCPHELPGRCQRLRGQRDMPMRELPLQLREISGAWH